MICSEILCESVNLGGKCWLNKCNECMNGRKLEKSFLGDKNVSWNEWRKMKSLGSLRIRRSNVGTGSRRVFESLQKNQKKNIGEIFLT